MLSRLERSHAQGVVVVVRVMLARLVKCRFFSSRRGVDARSRLDSSLNGGKLRNSRTLVRCHICLLRLRFLVERS